MEFYTIRLKRHPNLFVGKENPSYAITTDEEIQTCLKSGHAYWSTVEKILQVDAHWFKSEKYAKVWTDLKSIKRLFSYCA